MARNQRRRAQEALFAPAPSTTPPEEEKAAERTETAEKPIPGFIADKIFGPGFYDPKPNEQNPGDEIRLNPNLSDDEVKELERAFAALPSEPIRPISPEEHIARTYDIRPDCTNVPRLLYAILCELVRRRV